MPLAIETPKELASSVAERVRAERLTRGWTQAQLAERAAISLMTYRLFERTGQISLERLLSIVIVLGRAMEWDGLFRPRAARSLDELGADQPQRQRGISRRRTRHPVVTAPAAADTQAGTRSTTEREG